MYRTVLRVFSDNEVLLQGLPGVWKNYVLLRSMVGELDVKIQEQMMNLKGIAEDKGKAKEGLIGMTMVLTGMLQAYAAEQGDEVLYGMVDYSRTGLRRTRTGSLHVVCTLVEKEVEKRRAELVDYGMTEGVWQGFKVAKGCYAEVMDGPVLAKKMRKACTAEIEAIDLRIRLHLKRRMDKSMEVLGLNERLLMERYRAARDIYDRRGNRGRKLKGKVAARAHEGVIMFAQGVYMAPRVVLGLRVAGACG